MNKNRKYTDDYLIKTAQSFTTLYDLRTQRRNIYSLIWARKLQDKAFSGLIKKTHKTLYTNTECRLEARKYKTTKDFRQGSPAHYKRARSKGWDNVFNTLSDSRERITFEKCHNAFKRHKYLFLVRQSSPREYDKAKRSGWFDEIAKGLNPISRRQFEIKKKWPRMRIIAVYKKCRTMRDFKTNFHSAYTSATLFGYIDEIKLYYDRLSLKGDAPKPGEKTALYTQIREAKEEQRRVKKKKLADYQKGLIEKASRYKSRSSLRSGNISLYNAISSRRLWSYLPHLPVLRKANNTTVRAVRLDAAKCKGVGEFSRRYKRSYERAKKLLLLDELFPVPLYKKWTAPEIWAVVPKYTSPGELHKNNGGAYMKARRLGIYPEIVAYYNSLK